MVAGIKWYLARLVYQVIRGDGNHAPQFDEQLRLIRADELSWAREKASVLAQIGAFTFENSRKQNAIWKFIDVTDVFEIDSIEDGAQLYSMTDEPDDVMAYMELTKARAMRALALAHDRQSLTIT